MAKINVFLIIFLVLFSSSVLGIMSPITVYGEMPSGYDNFSCKDVHCEGGIFEDSRFILTATVEDSINLSIVFWGKDIFEYVLEDAEPWGIYNLEFEDVAKVIEVSSSKTGGNAPDDSVLLRVDEVVRSGNQTFIESELKDLFNSRDELNVSVFKESPKMQRKPIFLAFVVFFCLLAVFVILYRKIY